MRDATKVYGKYISEALTKDYTHAMTRFDSIVKDFRACKKIDGTSLGLLSELLMYISKFVEEHAVDQNITGLKGAKDKIRAAADALDNAAEKARKGAAGNGELGINDMSPVGDSGDESGLGGEDSGLGDGMDGEDPSKENLDGEDADKLPSEDGDKAPGSEADLPPDGTLDAAPKKPAMKGKIGSLGGDTDFEPLPTR